MRKKGNVDLKPRSQLPPGGPRALKPDVPPPPPPRSPLKTSGSADSTPPPPPRSPLKPPGSADSTGTGTATDKHIHHVRGGEKPATFPRLENLNRTKSNQYSKLKLPAFDDGVTSRSSGDISGGRSQTSPQEEPTSDAVDESRSRHTLPADVGRTVEETEDQVPPPIPVSIRKQRYRIRSTEVTSLDETASYFPDKPPPLPKKKRKSLPHLFRQISHSSETPSAGKSSPGTRRTSLPTPTGATKTFRQTSVPSMDDPEGPDQEVVRHWTRKDVKAWIKASWPKHLTTYRKKFYSKKIDGEALLALTEERLAEELKVQQPEDRSAIMELVKSMRTAGSKESFVDEQDEEMFHAGPLYQNSEMQEEHQDTAGAEAHGAEAEAQGAGIMRGRTRSLWRNFSMVKKDARVEQLQDKEVALQEAKYEVISLHVSLLKSLKVLVDVFESDETLMGIMGQHNHRRLFAGTEGLMAMSRSLVKELKQSFNRDVLMTEFLTLGTYNRYFMDYHTYCRTAVYQQALLQKLLQASGEFAVRIDQLEIYPRCCGNRLDSFLKIPQQHITKLKTVFEGILRHAPKGSSEERSAYEIIKAMEKTIKTCEEAVAAMTESLELQEKLTFRKTKEVEVASPDRWLERVGEFSELRGGRISSPEAPVLMFLFNDMILITRREATDGVAVQDYAPRRLVEVLSVGQALCRAFGMEDLYQITLAANHRGVMEELVLHPETSDDVDLLLSVPVSDEQVSNDTDEDVEYGVITESFSITDTADKPIVFEEGDVVKIYGGLEDLETSVHAVRMTDGQVGVLPGHVIGVVSGESGGYGSRERCTSATVVPKHMSTTQRDPVITTRVPSMVLVPRVPSLVRTKRKGSSPEGYEGNQSPNTSISEYSHFDSLWSLAQERLDASVHDSSDKFNLVSSNFAAGVFDERGGHLSILEKGISLFIPPGAIAGGPTKIYIYLESIDVHQDETLPEGQAMMSSTLYCGPPGTQFDEDVVFTLPYQGTGCDAMWNVFPVQTQTAVGETPDWRSLTDDDQAMHFLSNGFCTYFVSHFTGFGVVGDCSRSDGARVKIFRFGAFASPREMRGRNRRVRVRCWEGKKSELERVLQLEECEHSGKLIDAHRPLPLREGRGDVCMAATDTAAGWQLRGCGEQSIPEILLWMEEEEPVDSSCTFEFHATNDKPGRFGCTVKIYQEETPKTLVRLNASDSEETQQESSSGPPNEPPNLRFLRLQPELQPIKQDGALLPPSAHRQICAVLDVHSPLGNDWHAFAEKLGLPFDTIRWVEGKRPTARLLYYWEHTNAGGGSLALRNLKQIFQELEREDVTEILSEVIPLYSNDPESYRKGRRSTEPSDSGRNERADKEQCSPRKFSDSVITMATKDRSRMLKKGGSKDNLDVQSSRVSQRLSESTRAISVF
ncbi:uncharacterized protein LOC144867773 [Branchiostoma floridae x Branchiostoma japonicum]